MILNSNHFHSQYIWICVFLLQVRGKSRREAATACACSHRVASVEFALHPQHETSRGSGIQTKEDFKSKSRKRLGSLSTISWNSND